jgi:hypothetical protein
VDPAFIVAHALDQPNPRRYLSRQVDAWRQFANSRQGRLSTPLFLSQPTSDLERAPDDLLGNRIKNVLYRCPSVSQVAKFFFY